MAFFTQEMIALLTNEFFLFHSLGRQAVFPVQLIKNSP